MFNKKYMNKRLSIFVMAAAVASLTMAGCGSGSSSSACADPVALIGETTAGDSVSDWSMMAMALSGEKEDYSSYLDNLEAYVTDAYETDGTLDDVKATEYHRIALTVLALGGDPTEFGTDEDGNAVDLIADGTSEFTGSLGAQGLNGWIYALITLDSQNYPDSEATDASRERIINEILDAQEEDGGFGLTEGSSSVDITAMAVQALAPYALDQNYNDVSVDTDIAEVVEQALDYLSDQQCDDGAFTSGDEETCESTSQVILALCDMQIDPSEDDRFIKDDNSVADALEAFKNSDGNYKHAADDENSDALSTAQAMLATVAMQRLDDGENRIFDFTSYEGPTED